MTIPSRMLQESLAVFATISFFCGCNLCCKDFLMVLLFFVLLAPAVSLPDDMNIPHPFGISPVCNVVLFYYHIFYIVPRLILKLFILIKQCQKPIYVLLL